MQYHCGPIVTATLTAMPQQQQVMMMQRHDASIVKHTRLLHSACTVFYSFCTVCTKLCAQEQELLT